MKFLYEIEDSIVGIVVGALLLSPLLVQIPYSAIIFPLAFGIFLIFNFLDIVHCVKEFKGYAKICTISIIVNVIDIFINMAFLSRLLNIEIPFVTSSILPLITPTTTNVIALYLIIFNLWWIVHYHKK